MRSSRRLRLNLPACRAFPYYIPEDWINRVFDCVETNPDFQLLPILNEASEEAGDDLTKLLELDCKARAAVFLTVDQWDGDGEWMAQARELCLSSSLVFGHQLPRNVGGDTAFRALLLPSLIPHARRFRFPPEPTNHIFFAGALAANGDADARVRTREHRTFLAGRLAQGVSGDHSVMMEPKRYWRASEADRAAMRRRMAREIDHSWIGFCPSGFSYYCFRHSEVMARGRVVLSEPIHRHVRVPEPERWEQGEVALVFNSDGDDILKVVHRALQEPRALAEIARSGYEYARRWSRPWQQLLYIERTMRACLTA